MEPLDPAKNDEGSGFSKRRISSILKAPRRSVRFPEPQQQEHVVECAKPVEKRTSRRVSFAAANDVLLFSKDVKNASPARSPSQELITTATATQNRVQVAVTEDWIQQIMGMETLLNAPLHASQQRDKTDVDTGQDFGEKTVMFSTDDAFMNMTHSHTINIAGLVADISLQNYDSLPVRGENRVKITASDGAMDMSLSHNLSTGSVSVPTSRNMDLRVDKRNKLSPAPTLDAGFENFLASLSKPSDSGVNPVITTLAPAASSERANCSTAQIQTQRADVDKENQAPTSVSAVMEKSLSSSRKVAEFSFGRSLCPEEDLSMDRTEAPTGRILGLTDDDGPFQWRFPIQEMYSHHDSRVSQTKEKTKKEQISKPQAPVNPQDMTSLKNPSQHDFNQRHEQSLNTSRASGESFDGGTVCPEEDVSMDMTEAQTGRIRGPTGSNDPFQFLFPTQDMYTSCGSVKKQEMTSGQNPVKFATEGDCGEKTVRFTAQDAAMDMTQVLNVDIASNLLSDALLPVKKQDGQPRNGSAHSLNPSFTTSLSKSSGPSGDPVIRRMTPTAAQSSDIRDSSNGGTVCPEEDVSMDMTGAQTGRTIGLTGSGEPFQFLFPTQDMYTSCGSVKKQEMTSGQQHNEALGSSNRKGMETSLKTMVQRNPVKFATEGNCGEKTVRFTAQDAAMDMTQVLNVDIASNLLSDALLPVKKQDGQPRNRSAHSLNPSFTTSLSKSSGPTGDPVIRRMTPTAAQSSDIRDSSNGGTVCPEEDVSMDMTGAQTGRTIGLTGSGEPFQFLFPTQDMYTSCGSVKKQEMTSGQQHNEALGSSNRKGTELK
ncbi:uncharacterized protein PEZ65_017961 [Lycodopsis pacificus]